MGQQLGRQKEGSALSKLRQWVDGDPLHLIVTLGLNHLLHQPRSHNDISLLHFICRSVCVVSGRLVWWLDLVLIVRREVLGSATHEELSLDSVVLLYTYAMDVDTLTQVVYHLECLV
ncbi:MAG: hypothetical protein M3H12_01755, partial [Chromatiales bacterium]